jgi:hypothetical protein
MNSNGDGTSDYLEHQGYEFTEKFKGRHNASTPVGIVMQDLYEPWKKVDSNLQSYNPWLR